MLKDILNKIKAKKNYLLLLTLLPLIIDIITKYIIRTSFYLGESKEVISGLFNLTFVLNPGAAFGIFQNMHESIRGTFFIIMISIALVLIGYLFISEKSKLSTIALSLILSGALGNLLDRIIVGKVVDFLDFYIGNSHWPAFNVADSCVTCGVIIMLIDLIFFKRKEKE